VFNVVSLERNAQSFENVEISVTELQKIVFNTLYTWISAHHSLLVSSFADFLNFNSSFSSD
jgi:predicted metallo-beta-lactamase superfamily hydrolase